MEKYDVIIIGAGIGGLTCAALLAKKGVRVAVFEKEPRPGGYCCSFSASGYSFDACIDSIGGLRAREPLRRILEDDLGVFDRLDVYELNPTRRNIFPGMTIDIPADLIQYKESLQSIFSPEAAGIEQVFSLMEKIYTSSIVSMRENSASDFLLSMLNKSSYEVLASFIKDEKLLAVLSSYCTFLGLGAQEVSIIAASNILMHYVKGGTFRIRGGIQTLSDVLADKVNACGGKIFLNEEVTDIFCSNGTIQGIATKSGMRCAAGSIVSNMDITTALSLMKKNGLTKDTLRKLDGLEVSGSFVIAYLGVTDDLRAYDFAPSIGCFSSYDLDAMLNTNDQITFGFSIPSVLDTALAPPGGGTVVIPWPFCYNRGVAPFASKDEVGKRVLRAFAQVVPDIQGKIEYMSIAGPSTLERYTGNRRGAAYGWKQSTELFKSLPYLRKIAGNFHMVGHWAGYGGGVMPSMLSAHKVAKEIIQ